MRHLCGERIPVTHAALSVGGHIGWRKLQGMVRGEAGKKSRGNGRLER